MAGCDEWAVAEAYKPQRGNSQPQPQPHKHRNPRMTTVGGGLPSVRKQARALERLLKRGTLPDNVRQEKELALNQLTEKAAANKRIERERHFSKKYHKVKFFERLKVEKCIGLLQKQLAEASAANRGPLEEQLREAEHNLLYVQHFPRHKKYLSLFPSEENPFVAKKRARIRAMLVRRSAEGTLESKPEGKRGRATASRGLNVGEGDEESEGEYEGDGLAGDAFFEVEEEPAKEMVIAPAKKGKKGRRQAAETQAEGEPAKEDMVIALAKKGKKGRRQTAETQAEEAQAAESQAAEAIQPAGFKSAPGLAKAKRSSVHKKQGSPVQPEHRHVSGKRKRDSAAPHKSWGAMGKKAKDACI